MISPFNLCNLPPWAIASRNFNRHPQALEIQGVRHSHQRLFTSLDGIETRLARGQQFHDYMDVVFQLHQWESADTSSSRKSLKNSYLRFLRGWMFDSNSREGAVLKGWVESRLGLPPTFHRVPIADIHDDAYHAYLVERMQGVARTSALMAHFDLLYEFVQAGMAVVISTPYMDEAERCSRVGLVHQGRLLLEGRPRELLAASGRPSFEELFVHAVESASPAAALAWASFL